MLKRIAKAVSHAVKTPIRKCAKVVCKMTPFQLSYSYHTAVAQFELTSKCNLRCIYCGKSSDHNENTRVFDLPEDRVLSAIRLLRKRGLELVYMSGIGETTTRKGWEQICRKTLEGHIAHTIITNLAKPLTDDEADVLAHFSSVQVSGDTCDPELFAKIRRGATLERVTANIKKIRDSAKKLGIRGPELRLDMVVTDKTVFGLEKTVQWGMQQGMTDFYLAGLCKQGDLSQDFNVYPVKTLPSPQLEEALKCIERAADIVRAAGCQVAVHDGLVQGIQVELEQRKQASNAATMASKAVTHQWDSPAVNPGFTRDCMDPWNILFLYAHGEVRPCCCYDRPIGNVSDTTLEKIINGPQVKKMRQNLLKGELDGMLCKRCSMHPPIRIDDYHRKVWRHHAEWLARRMLGEKIVRWVLS